MDIPPNFRCPYKTSPAQTETFYRMAIILTFTGLYFSKEICNRLQIKRPKPTFSTSSPQRHRLNPLASPFTFPAACQLVTQVNKIQQVTHQSVPVHNQLHLACHFFFLFSERAEEWLFREKLLPWTPPPMHWNLPDSTIHQRSKLCMLSHPPEQPVWETQQQQVPAPLAATTRLSCRRGRLLTWAVKGHRPTRAVAESQSGLCGYKGEINQS